MNVRAAIADRDVGQLPGKRDEDWRWTDLRGLLRTLPARSSALDASLATGVTTAQQSFGESMAAADGDLAELGWGTVVALLVAAGLVALGFRPRIAEYR